MGCELFDVQNAILDCNVQCSKKCVVPGEVVVLELYTLARAIAYAAESRGYALMLEQDEQPTVRTFGSSCVVQSEHWFSDAASRLQSLGIDVECVQECIRLADRAAEAWREGNAGLLGERWMLRLCQELNLFEREVLLRQCCPQSTEVARSTRGGTSRILSF